MRAACFHSVYILEKLIHASGISKILFYNIREGFGNQSMWQAQHKLIGVLNPHSQEIIDLRRLLSLSGKLAIARAEAGLAKWLHAFCTSSNSSPGSTPGTQLVRIRPAVWSSGYWLYPHTEARSTRLCQVLAKSLRSFPALPHLPFQVWKADV